MTSKEQSKAFYLAETVTLIGKNFLSDEQITRDLKSIIDTIMHTAPEVTNKRWMDIYLYCSKHFTDIDNMQHFKAFNLYQSRYSEYKTLFL
jgi:hypothetical protein|uniref:Uncharacterized protein n=1 Tax=viral metagenome TaxID=1070528 RepID=A0A6C0IPG3_9ZZZZ